MSHAVFKNVGLFIPGIIADDPDSSNHHVQNGPIRSMNDERDVDWCMKIARGRMFRDTAQTTSHSVSSCFSFRQKPPTPLDRFNTIVIRQRPSHGHPIIRYPIRSLCWSAPTLMQTLPKEEREQDQEADGVSSTIMHAAPKYML